VRVTVDDSGDSINVLNEVSGLRMSVSDTGTATATTLGIRTFTGSTLVNDLNDGRGVEIADGATDENGLPDPNRNVDFRVTLSDGSTSFDVDLTPGDMDTVQSVVDAINAAWTAAGPPPGGFAASVNPAGNGILFTDAAGGAQTMQVTSLNGYAAEDLGLLAGEGSVTTGVGAELAGEDRATVRVDSLFSTLIELRESLLNDDVRGITFAGGRLDADAERLTESRALVGSRTATVERVRERQQQNELLDREIKSQLQDLDFFEASSRYSLLQTQLQAALTVTAQSQQLSLINFLG
jgi:flagellin-like hook-associated protein FlgL